MINIHSSVLLMFLIFSCSSPTKKEIATGISLQAEQYIPEVDGKMNEISGLMIYDDHLWGFNDSGGKNELYGFNKSGKIKYEIELDDAKNRDWESITQNDKHVFVGDFGNNGGNRDNLRIYKIRKKDISNKDEQKVDVKEIEFEYADQERFTYLDQTTPFDCEAMVAFKNKLYLFSKNWRDRTTWQYELPTKKGKYDITPTDTFNVKGLVTGADISPNKKILALVGYENFQSFIWLFSDFPEDRFFEGQSQTIYLEGIDGAQTEGICFLNNDSILVSCEKTRTHDQQVFLFDLKKLNDGTH
ncbi:hypothetical protein [Draconibacterium halophilum]|uniref:T9SS C-terminal target domain-containing protein n=1 Tax=Draconibacterium halophilum TaxID=2706887 RepID=A0A6C0RGJ5_9BACT|nr:hypothetical protein [Draconibacterium halophilum]QIA09838.1 hypothetical protein G0Q07_19975 [Draconibacterium halophilum]